MSLYRNIAAKKKRIKAGSGETMKKAGAKGRPTAKSFKQAAKTAKKKQMWSSPVELYPVHITPLPPSGMAYVVEPQVTRNKEYMIVQPISKPYEVNAYSTLHWVA